MSARRVGAHVVVASLMSLIGVVAVGCRKGPGSKCKPGESTCLDGRSALVCQGGAFVQAPCAGPLGCTTFEDHANCDNSVASDGDACMGRTDDEYACTPDKKRALVCKSGRFARYLECRGKAGCAQLGHMVSCDTTVAAAGDPCKTQGATACTEDQKQMVVCRDGKFALHRHCRGQSGCSMLGDTPSCDLTKSLEGDPCGPPGQVVCSLDGQSELVCQGSTFMHARGCKKNGCVVTNRAGRNIECD